MTTPDDKTVFTQDELSTLAGALNRVQWELRKERTNLHAVLETAALPTLSPRDTRRLMMLDESIDKIETLRVKVAALRDELESVTQS